MVRRKVVPTVLVIAVVIALVSISYPSVVVPNITTQQFPGFETYTSQYEVGYLQPTASTMLTGYSTVTAWYPGNPICDPTSNACTPYPTPMATLTYPQSATYTYQVTLSSETIFGGTSEFTIFSTQTNYQNIPPFAALGLTDLQFGIVAFIIIAVLVLGLLFIFTKNVVNGRIQNSGSKESIRFCERCGTANPNAGKFCTGCGVRLE